MSSLDAELGQEMRAEISRLHERLDATMIHVTHNQVEAMTRADKIAVLRAGKIEQYGTPRDLYSNPVNVLAARSIGSPKMNLINATVVTNENGQGIARLDTGEGWTIQFTGSDSARPGQKILIGTRPQHIKINEGGDFSVHAGIVEGSGTAARIVGTFQENIPFIMSTAGDIDVKPHDTVSFTFDSWQLLIFDAETQMPLP